MVIKTSIQVDIDSALFWAALQSPDLANGGAGYYLCDWTANSEIYWVSNLKGGEFRGKILQVQQQRYLSFIQYHSTLKHQVTSLFCYQIERLETMLLVRLTVDLVEVCNPSQHIVLEHWLNDHLQNIYALAKGIKSSFQLPLPPALQKKNEYEKL